MKSRLKFTLSFKDYERAWHQNIQDKKPSSDSMYWDGQFDEIPYYNWEEMFGVVGDTERDFVEFEL